MGRSKVVGIFCVLCFMLCTLSVVSAADFNHVVINSENWQDVFSGMHFSTLNEVEGDFLTSANHGNILVGTFNENSSVFVLSSKNSEYILNYPDLIKSKGIEDVNEISSRNLNLRLAEEMESINNFVVVDTSYGYNAIAVVPYAVQKKSWILFADRKNIDEVESLLAKRNVEEILVYGYVDREVRDSLEKFSPKVINNQDRFEDNVEITKEYLKMRDTKQILLTNGDFIEKELMTGAQPILFTGKQNVPDQIRDYLKTSDIEIGVLIGNELMGAATNIRRSTGISVMVKFARGARVQKEGIAAVEGLDLFPLPAPLLNLEIYGVKYNRLSQQLEVTYKSSSNIPIYLKGTITLNNDKKIGDSEVVFISPNNYNTVVYSVEMEDVEDMQADVFVIYGESRSALDLVLDEEREVEVVDVIDRCELDVKDVSYNKQKNEFKVKVKNLAEVNCFADLSITDLLTGYESKDISTEQVYMIPALGSETLVINEVLVDSDLEKNNFVNLIIRFGEKETGLVKTFKGSFELNVKSLTTTTYVMIAVAVLMIAFVLLFFWRRKQDNDEFDF